ncbi:NPCBM/NEW2 domain-containing protein [Neorhodopirellula pilleata]|uniref:NPCBM/NEW2 domain protein n=1 Tax=Neorhodopirellula pilleata TaxID=2714738 RepID=A0A5C5ZZJ0_9BACT|nr:NPCBM/NEW2 domain-containing protein [Neorhodopirellula pilleata]TWT92984.1 NPCBM/NEW2 domain protein [Neorhodopirellula pilleata]
MRTFVYFVWFAGWFFTSGGDVSNASETETSLATSRIETAIQADPIDSPGQVVVAYFTPRDRKPAADHHARINRIVEETGGFYQRELARHGFHGRRLNVLRTNSGEVDIIDVVGRENDANYGKPDGRKIRDEVIEVLRLRDIDASRCVLLLFCNLMDYEAEKGTISHHSPYYGGGNHLSGTAWQCDSEILDPLRFNDMTPIRDGEYGNITIGRHNSIFIGGVIHELGHALSLPHCRQRADESVRGTALMGSGNRTYRQELRGEGRGTFLTLAHAFRLAAHPAMLSRVPASIHQDAAADWKRLKITNPESHVLRIEGSVESTVPVHAVIAYFDPAGGSDYDSTTATAIPQTDGHFELSSEPLPTGDAELRLVACHVNGTTSIRKFHYRVNSKGDILLDAVRLELELGSMIDLIRQSKFEAASETLARVSRDDASLRAIGQRVLDRFGIRAEPLSKDFNKVDENVKSLALSSLRPQSARVGWLRPTYNAVPERQSLLSIDGDYYADGIYAHAPAEHVYRLDGRWKRLRGRAGIQAGHDGKVDFRILGDGRLLWDSKGVTEETSVALDVDLSSIDILELHVDDGGNGTAADWGVWIEPTLTR